MDVTSFRANELRERVEEAVRVWFREHAAEGDMLTRIRYQLDVSYSEASDYSERIVGTDTFLLRDGQQDLS
jgi:hypothetical protein